MPERTRSAGPFVRSARWRRPTLGAAWGVLLVLISSAVYAPLLASDRPYHLRAVDTGAFEDARRTLSPIATSLVELLNAGPRQDAKRWKLRVDGELGALERRIEVLERFLDEGERARLAPLRASAAEIAEASVGPQRARREAAALVLVERARGAAALLERGALDARGARLRARTSWPLFAALGAFDLWLLLAWTLGLCARLVRGGGRGLPSRRVLALVLGLPTVLALFHVALFESSGARGGPGIKQGLTSGAIVPESVVAPPVFYGYAETHTEEAFRAPSWFGQRARGAPSAADAPMGLRPRRAEARVRFGEPPADSPWRHLAGTDALGRDLFTRLLWGGRISLAVGFAAALGMSLIGVLLGGLSGFCGGWVDALVLRLIEAVLSIPALFLIILAAAYVDPSALHPVVAIVAIIALVAWTGIARLVRSELLRLREEPYVLAARALGFSPWRVLVRHALPNALSPALVAAAFAVGGGILVESAVSYLGFGVRHPFPSWGALINESRSAEHWWVLLVPGLCIFLAVTATNLIGEGLRDALDPRAEGPRP